MLQVFQMDVESKSGCCICCNGCTCMSQRSVTNVSSVFFRTYIASVFIWMRHMFHTYIRCMCLSGCCVCLQWFSSVFRCFFKCFRSMFQMFHLPSDVCCNCCIWMFQKQIGCYISPPRLLLHCLGVSSSRCRQGIHTTPRRPGPSKSEAASFPSCRSGGVGPAWSETECSVRASIRTSKR
jgi:hypothetical protein